MGILNLIFNYLVVAETAAAAMFVFILLIFRKNRKANFFFAAFIIINSIAFLPFYFWTNDNPAMAYYFALITMPANSITGIFIYYYTLFMTGAAERIRKKDLLHFMIYIVFLIIQIIFFKPVMLDHLVIQPLILLITGGGMMYSLVYILMSYVKIRRYSLHIVHYFSNTERIDMGWLIKILYFPILFLIVTIAGFWITFFSRPSPYVIMTDMLMFMFMLFMSAFYIINQPEISSENREMYTILHASHSRDKNPDVRGKYSKINLDINRQEIYLKLLTEYIEKNKPYLNERITIKELSEGLRLPYHHISVVINNLLKKNFYDFINEYRIREVIDILNRSKNENINILTVAFKCGFNSKSSFNRVFKQITGMTPSVYREKNK